MTASATLFACVVLQAQQGCDRAEPESPPTSQAEPVAPTTTPAAPGKQEAPTVAAPTVAAPTPVAADPPAKKPEKTGPHDFEPSPEARFFSASKSGELPHWTPPPADPEPQPQNQAPPLQQAAGD